ncbi:hypothetical protein [Nostoc sp. 'Lobaria pulmonaria (5183) cyanobiont']|uniref:hypothetical protein n=1 Tax=Nostoc sp. 'Lobaria pulmonaria (5183) cyanobiont' TaxID=1618022 RepID=UPI000CF31AC3|nr:hypothetical protein [Nostoc sp. 'Lobaria pulmonaria (5183) cyanobiont']AVH71589.1 hypothetical protein NLP_2999 [Nostoc sp. 'Lobaria pulmonaria (5183) cyanobiont']
MTRNLDLSTESNWQLMYSVSIPATVIGTVGGKTYYAKITPIRPGIILDKAVLGIAINTTIPTGKRWSYAGSLSRFTDSSLGEIDIDKRKPLFLGRFNLAISDNLSNNYQLEIQVPKWFISCNLGIYQYEGDSRTIIEQELDVIKSAVISG